MNQKQKGILILILLVIAMVVHYQDKIPIKRMAGDPAEAYCLSQNYTTDTRQNSAGTYNICIVGDVEWELWNFFRTENPIEPFDCSLINETVPVWIIQNESCVYIAENDDCNRPDYLSSFPIEAQCRAVLGEEPITEPEAEPELTTYWTIEEDICVTEGPQEQPPEAEYWTSLQACLDTLDARDPLKFTSEINPNVLEAYQQVLAEPRAEIEEPRKFYESTNFWIILILLIIISLIYGIWEKGPKRGFFKK